MIIQIMFIFLCINSFYFSSARRTKTFTCIANGKFTKCCLFNNVYMFKVYNNKMYNACNCYNKLL